MNLWKDLPVGTDSPNSINVIVEIPKGSRNKYEFDKKTGTLRLDRVLYSSIHYPGDYGLIPQTFYDDGDPLDVLVMVNEPTFSGCIIKARPIGLFRMKDRGEPDDKILAVPQQDPFFRDYHDIVDIPQHFLQEIAHFFSVYKDLEGAHVKTIGWEGAVSAKKCIVYSVGLYKKKKRGKKSNTSSVRKK
jgi:inorganic pyrophosphatase